MLTGGRHRGGSAAGHPLTGPLFALSPMASDATGKAMREFDSSGADRHAGPARVRRHGARGRRRRGPLPAWRASRRDLRLAAGGLGARGATLDRGTRRTFAALVVWEIAVAAVLLTATGLVVRSFHNLVDEDWGFEIRGPPGVRRHVLGSAAARARAARRLRRAGARAAPRPARRRLRDRDDARRRQPRARPRRHHAGGHDAAAGARLLPRQPPHGRSRATSRTSESRSYAGEASSGPTSRDTQRVAVVSETFVRRHWPGLDPIGRTIRRGRAGDPRPPYVVVGVAARRQGRPGSAPTATCRASWYLPYAQNPGFLTNDVTFVVHARVTPASLEKPVRGRSRPSTPRSRPTTSTTVERLAENSYVQDRFARLLVGLFGAARAGPVGARALRAAVLPGRTAHARAGRARGARSAAEADILVARLPRRRAASCFPVSCSGSLGAAAVTRLLDSQLHGVRARRSRFRTRRPRSCLRGRGPRILAARAARGARRPDGALRTE